MTEPTIGYFCWICHEKNQLIYEKNFLYREAQNWKAQKQMGRADICFELYENLKHVIAPKTEHIKVIGRKLKAKPIYNQQDYAIVAIEMRSPQGRYEMIADNPKKIQELGEQFVMESIILGNYDDKP